MMMWGLACLIFLQGCSLLGPQKIEKLSIVLAPREVPQDLLSTGEAFKTALHAAMVKKGYDLQDIQITIGSSNADAQTQVVEGKADIAYLPVLNYVDALDDGLVLLASTTHMRLDLGNEDLSVYNVKSEQSTQTSLLPYRRSVIMTGPSVYGRQLYQKFSSGEEVTWIDLNQASWCHVLVTSLDGYIMPSLWLIDHYERRMGELFDHTLVVKGYLDMMASLANEDCDIAVGPDTLRNTYENMWTTSKDTDGFGRSANIYDEVKVIGATNKLYDDVFVTRPLVDSEDEFMDEKFVTALKDSLMSLANQTEAPLELFKLLGFEGLAQVDATEYEALIPALEYIQRIMN